MIIIIEGPTGVGKSTLALQLAQALDTEIIGADSRQIYRYLNIGTAKPGIEELNLIKHHMIDICDPKETYNAGQFASDVSRIAASLETSAKIPIICGGTGLYIRAFLEGLFEHPPFDPQIKARLLSELDEFGINEMYSRLMTIDPSFATKISSNDPQRILRGLEVYLATGKPISYHWSKQKPRPPQKILRLLVNIERESLYSQINSRLTAMLKLGLLEEINDLLTRGYTWTDPGLNSLGYKEFQAFFEGNATQEECADLAAQHHRNYAKRQITWYRKINYDLTIDPKHFSLSDILGALK